MRVAIFVSQFPVVSETFILRQITGLIDLGHEVDIYAESRPPAGAVTHAQVQAYRLLDRTTYLDLPQSAPAAQTIMWLAQAVMSAPVVTARALNPITGGGRRAIRRSTAYQLSLVGSRACRYDVLHAHFGPVANNMLHLRDLWDAPLVVSFHGYDFSRWPQIYGRHVYDRLFRATEIVTVNSEHTRQRVEQLGCLPERIRKLPVSVEAREFPFEERHLAPGDIVRILTVARLTEKKGVEYAVRAIARAREHYPSIRYDLVGDGPQRARIEDLAHDLKVDDIVALHGARDNRYVREMLAHAHIFMLPSVTASDGDEEGQGLVLQEAQAAGLPVLATMHNGFPESIVPGKSGFLVPERDVSALTERLLYLVGHPDRWPEMGRIGRAFVEDRFDASSLNRQLVAYYLEAIEQRRSRS